MAVPLCSTSVLVGSSFTEHPSGLDAVACTWTGRSGRRRRRLRMLPDGCADLLWDGATLRVSGPVAAPMEHLVGSATMVGLRLRAGAVGAVLGVPASELPPAGVDLDAVWGRPARRWTRRLADADLTDRARAVLEEMVAARLRAGHSPDPLVTRVVRDLTAPGRPIDDVAGDVGLSARELRRRFHDHVGHGPKALQRVLRFRRVITAADALADGRLTLATAAARFGYADQAHLCREARALAGASPRALLATWSAHAGRNVQDQPPERR